MKIHNTTYAHTFKHKMMLAARLEHQQDDTKEIYFLDNGTSGQWMLGFLRGEEIEGTRTNLV
jgi:hypothetical protein